MGSRKRRYFPPHGRSEPSVEPMRSWSKWTVRMYASWNRESADQFDTPYNVVLGVVNQRADPVGQHPRRGIGPQELCQLLRVLVGVEPETRAPARFSTRAGASGCQQRGRIAKNEKRRWVDCDTTHRRPKNPEAWSRVCIG